MGSWVMDHAEEQASQGSLCPTSKLKLQRSMPMPRAVEDCILELQFNLQIKSLNIRGKNLTVGLLVARGKRLFTLEVRMGNCTLQFDPLQSLGRSKRWILNGIPRSCGLETVLVSC